MPVRAKEKGGEAKKTSLGRSTTSRQDSKVGRERSERTTGGW